MSRYVDWSDVTNKYADMATKGGANETREPFLDAAEDEMDSWLAPFYTVPFTPCPGTVKDLTIDLAYYKATIMRKGSKALWDYIQLRLKAIQDGTLQLVASGTVIERALQPFASRVAMVSSTPPQGGYSVEDPCYFDRPQS